MLYKNLATSCRGSWHFASREMLLHSWVCRESDVYSLGNMLACLARLKCFPYPREYSWRDIAGLVIQPDGGLPEVASSGRLFVCHLQFSALRGADFGVLLSSAGHWHGYETLMRCSC